MKKERLKETIYAALLGERPWQDFLDQLAMTTPDGKAALVMHDTVSRDGYALFGGSDDGVFHSYNEYFSALNPFQPKLARMPEASGAADPELHPRDLLVKTEFFNEFLLPYGMTCTAGAKIVQFGSQSFTLATAGDAADPIWESVDLLRQLAPHLKRALRFYRKEGTLQTAVETGMSSLDAIGTGVIILTDDRRLRFISETGKEMLAASSPIRFLSGQRIRFRNHEIQMVLEQMLKLHYVGPETFDTVSHKTRLTLIRMNRDPVSNYFMGAKVIVLMEQLNRRSRPFDPQLFSASYGLSAGETRALVGIVAGKTAAQIAEEAGLSRETIRAQLKSLYAKTATSGATEVLRLALG